MISKEELIDLLSDIESSRIERTISTNNTDKFCEAICAFANDYPNNKKPGYMIIGADDKTGKICNIPVTDELLRNVGGIRSDGNVLPSPAMSVEKFTFPEGELAVVEVQPSTLPPVRYKGRVWIRVGPRKAVANEQEERILSERRSFLTSTFDTVHIQEATVSDLSIVLFEEYRKLTVDPDTIAENHRSIEHKLAALRFFDLRFNAPTVAGILLFANNPRHFLPLAYIQFLRFRGTGMSEVPIDQAEISGDLRSVLEQVRIRIVSNIKTSMVRGEGFKERLIPDYPEWAIRELIHNAIIHRDYASNTPIHFYWFDDHIEIQSPGGLYGNVTPETLTYQNGYRNPIIAEACKVMGYINKFGYGIQRAQQLLAENGNPPAQFTIDDKMVRVTIFPRKENS